MGGPASSTHSAEPGPQLATTAAAPDLAAGLEVLRTTGRTPLGIGLSMYAQSRAKVLSVADLGLEKRSISDGLLLRQIHPGTAAGGEVPRVPIAEQEVAWKQGFLGARAHARYPHK